MKRCDYEIDGFCFHPKNKELRIIATPCNGYCDKQNNNSTIIKKKNTIKEEKLEEHKMNDDNTEDYCFNPAHLKPGILAIKKDDCEFCNELQS